MPYISDLWESFGEFQQIVADMRQEAREKRNARAREQRLERKEARLADAAATVAETESGNSESEFSDDDSADERHFEHLSVDHAGCAVAGSQSSAGMSGQASSASPVGTLSERPRLVIRLPAANRLKPSHPQPPMTPVATSLEASGSKGCVRILDCLTDTLFTNTFIFRLAAMGRNSNNIVERVEVRSVPSKRKTTAPALEPVDSIGGKHASQRQKRQRLMVSAYV